MERNWKCQVLKSIVFETFVGGTSGLFPLRGHRHSISKAVLEYYRTFEPEVPDSEIPFYESIPDGCFLLAGTLVRI